jgi:uncharacterized protein YegP (UPF0339 family)
MGGQFEVYKDKAGNYRWRLAHRSGLALADSGKGRRSKMAAIMDLWNALSAANTPPFISAKK